MIHLSALIRDKWPNRWQKERVEGLVLVGHDFRVMRRESPATDAFIMRHEDLSNKEFYTTKRMVHIIEEGPIEDLFILERPSLDSSIASAVIPLEEGVDRFRDNEDEETPLPILLSCSRGIIVAEVDIATLRREGIAVDDGNNLAPDNFMQSDDVFPTPSSLTLGFHGIGPWRQGGNFPVRRAKLKMTLIPRIQHMSHLDLFMKLYFIEYIKDVVIHETNKLLTSAMNLSEYFRVIGCRLIMACYVGHFFRDLFLKFPITPQKGAPIRLNHIISGRRLSGGVMGNFKNKSLKKGPT